MPQQPQRYACFEKVPIPLLHPNLVTPLLMLSETPFYQQYSGSVLVVLVGGLMAQGMASYDAAWMYGKAAMYIGTRLITEDIP